MVPNDAHLSKVFLVQIVAGLLLKLFGRKLFKTYITESGLLSSAKNFKTKIFFKLEKIYV